LYNKFNNVRGWRVSGRSRRGRISSGRRRRRSNAEYVRGDGIKELLQDRVDDSAHAVVRLIHNREGGGKGVGVAVPDTVDLSDVL
jgi:hypothetical protein